MGAVKDHKNSSSCSNSMDRKPALSKTSHANKVEFLGPQLDYHYGLKTLVLDLDETLVHSSFKTVSDPDILLPVCGIFERLGIN